MLVLSHVRFFVSQSRALQASTHCLVPGSLWNPLGHLVRQTVGVLVVSHSLPVSQSVSAAQRSHLPALHEPSPEKHSLLAVHA